MADSFLAYQNPTTTDKKLDSESLTVGVNTVERERIQISGAAATDIAPVSAADGLLVNLGTNNDITVASLPLPTGASTAAKQPALGTAGTASSDVITVQGIASMTPVQVASDAVEIASNSSTTPLGSGATFTGTAIDMDPYASISISVFADQASAANGLKVQWSSDGTNWDFTDQVNYVASSGNMITFGRKARYARVVFVNGATIQGVFRLATACQKISVRQTRKFIGTNVVDQDTGQVVIAAIQGHTTAGGGSWVDVKVNPSGALSVDGSGVTQPISGTVTATQATGTNLHMVVDSGTVSTITNVVHVDDNSGSLTVDGTVTANQGGTWTVQPGNTANTTPWLTTDSATGSTAATVPTKANYQGGIATTALPTATTAGQLVGEMYDKFGRPVVVLGTVRDLIGTQTTTISASTSETTIVTAAANIFNDLVMLIVSNTSASTNTRIDFRDTTGGSVLFSLFSIGGSPPTGFALPVPIPQTSVNTNWTAQCASSTTDIRIYAVFQKNK